MDIDLVLRELETLENKFVQVEQNRDYDQIKEVFLSKESLLSRILSIIKDLPQDKRSVVGKRANTLRKKAEELYSQVKQIHSFSKGKYDYFDVTLPGYKFKIGRLHPVTLVIREMNSIFRNMGFSVYAGPEIETDYYVFEVMNLPKNHPARSLQDTLVINDPEVILRSHTSSVEGRAMQNESIPLRIVVPGRVYRYEDLNATNHFAFFQYEGLAIAEDLTMADLKGVLDRFVKEFFGENVKTRFRAKYYPQVEPGAGVDISCLHCNGSGCQVCKYRGWMEMLGAGMVHPNSLRIMNIDPNKYTGFAWGMGLDRIVMQKYGINDIRDLYNGTLI